MTRNTVVVVVMAVVVVVLVVVTVVVVVTCRIVCLHPDDLDVGPQRLHIGRDA